MVMLDSGMGRTTDIGTLLSGFWAREEERMMTRFHGVDRHKNYSTISVLDRDGKEARFLRSCAIEDYLSNLGAGDAVVLEASCGCFYWVDRIEVTGATCYVLDPRRFRVDHRFLESLWFLPLRSSASAEAAAGPTGRVSRIPTGSSGL